MSAEPFEVSITEAEIADLRERLRRTRWPEREPVDDWSQGLPLAYAQELCRSWAEDYDFGFAERLNVFPQYRDTIDGLGIHFLHVRSPEPDAFPLVLTHGWPGSVLEFLEVLGPLTDPRAYGGDPADASVVARVRLERQAVDNRVGHHSHRTRLGHVDGLAGLPTVRRAGR
jgi:hypothetical protein